MTKLQKELGVTNFIDWTYKELTNFYKKIKDSDIKKMWNNMLKSLKFLIDLGILNDMGQTNDITQYDKSIKHLSDKIEGFIEEYI